MALVACLAFLIPATTASGQQNPFQNPTVCWDGSIAIGAPCPGYAAATQAVSGLLPPAAVTTTRCAPSDAVYRLIRNLELVNGYTRGVQASCKRPDGSVYNLPLIGQGSSTGGASGCAPGEFAVGIYGRAGDVVDGFGVLCNTTGATPSPGLYQGGVGGFAQGPFACPSSGSAKRVLVGVAGGGVPYAGGFNITKLYGVCEPRAGYASAGGATTTSYRASGPRGAVRFRMLVSQTQGEPASWYYAVEKLVVATACSRSTRVPGAILVADRRKRSERSRFNARLGGFRIKGHVFGSLAKPKVRATVKVLKGACRGEKVEFTARSRR